MENVETSEIENMIKQNEIKLQEVMLNKIKSLEKTLLEKEDIISKVTNNLEKLKKEYSDSLELIEERDKDIQVLESNYDSVLNAVDSKESIIYSLELKCRDLEERIVSEKNNYSALEESYKIKLKKQSNLSKEKTQFLELENSALKENYNSITEKINQLVEFNNQITQKNYDLEKSLSEYKELYSSNQKEVSTCQTTIIKQDSQIKAYLDNITQLNLSVEKLTKELVQSQKREGELSKILEMKEEEHNSLNESLIVIKSKNKQLIEENSTHKLENYNFQYQIKDLKEKFSLLEKEKTGLEESNETLKHNNVDIEYKLKKEKADLKLEKKTNTELNEKINIIEQDLLTLSESKAIVEKEKEKLIKENKALNEKLKYYEEINVNEKFKDYEEQINKYKNEIKALQEKIKSTEKQLNLFSERLDSNNNKKRGNSNNNLANSLDKLNDFFLNASNEDLDYFKRQGNKEDKENEYKKEQIIKTLQANLEEKQNQIEGLNNIINEIDKKINSMTNEFEEEKYKYKLKIDELEIALNQEKMNSSQNNGYNFQTNVQTGFNEFKLKDELAKIKKEREKLAVLCSSLREKNNNLENNITLLKQKIAHYTMLLKQNYNENYDYNKPNTEVLGRTNSLTNINYNTLPKFSNIYNNNNNNKNRQESNERNNLFFCDPFHSTKKTTNNNQIANLNVDQNEFEDLKLKKSRILKNSLNKQEHFSNNRPDINYNDTLPYDGVNKIRSKSTKKSNNSSAKIPINQSDVNKFINIRKIVYNSDKENEWEKEQENNPIIIGQPMQVDQMLNNKKKNINSSKSKSNSKGKSKKKSLLNINFNENYDYLDNKRGESQEEQKARTNTSKKNFKLIRGGSKNK